MKMSTAAWSGIQNECYTDEENSSTFRSREHEALWYLIENRTWGKRWSQDIAIGVNRTGHGNLEPLVKEAQERIAARKEQGS